MEQKCYKLHTYFIKKIKRVNDYLPRINRNLSYSIYVKRSLFNHGMEVIAGFTENGVPYGLLKEDREKYIVRKLNNYGVSDDELQL